MKDGSCYTRSALNWLLQLAAFLVYTLPQSGGAAQDIASSVHTSLASPG